MASTSNVRSRAVDTRLHTLFCGLITAMISRMSSSYYPSVSVKHWIPSSAMKRDSTPINYPDPLPQLPIEQGPEGKGVGAWVPREKHQLLRKYLDASRYAWRDWRSRVFIDPFSGPGRIRVEGEGITRDGGAVVAWRSLCKEAPFTNMFVGDLVKERATACARRLQALGAPARAFPGSAQETVKAMVAAVPPLSLCMAFIDPYNLEFLSSEVVGTQKN